MKKITLLVISIVFISSIKAQSLYFPPLTGNVWDSIFPTSIGYCQPRIDSLYNYLQAKNTKSFIILKDGKRVLEKYFGTYTKDSLWYWASASKSLSAFITGIAQQKGFININNPVSQYLGTGWTSAPLVKENMITVRNLIQMNSGLDDAPPLPCDHLDSSKACLIYKADAGTRWGYHTGAYYKSHDVVSEAVGQSYNVITTSWIKSKIGMTGTWFQNIYYGKARDMARFGLLNLNKGIWQNDTIMKDSLYFKAMVNTSQPQNEAYGYLWWLNGKATGMAPSSQFVIPGALFPNAPADMFCALGKNDQKIYVVPSQKMVIVRQGNTAGGFNLAASAFDNVLWDYINKLNCVTTVNDLDNENNVSLYPNPTNELIHINMSLTQNENITLSIINTLGQSVMQKHINGEHDTIIVSDLKSGVYFMKFTYNNKTVLKKIVIGKF